MNSRPFPPPPLPSPDRIPVRRALLSVSDKTGLAELAAGLAAAGVELISTGGTAAALRAAGLAAREVSELTGFPEIMGGRVKTLHPLVHGGLLGRGAADADDAAAHGIAPIELLVVNLYPFARVAARPDCAPEAAVEQIDVGGPAMLRAAAKNHAHCCPVADPADYPRVLAAARNGGTDRALRLELAAKAFAHTAAYDGDIARHLEGRRDPDSRFGRYLRLALDRGMPLRYGENPHQRAAFYRYPGAGADTLAGAVVHQGRELSFNNLVDADAAWECIHAFAEPACVIVKHANPCGAAAAASPADAYDAAYATDPTSAFGGIVAFNRPLDADAARRVLERQFVEVLIAPGYGAGALAALATRPGVRVLSAAAPAADHTGCARVRSVSGGLLVQEPDRALLGGEAPRVVTARAPSEAETRDLRFAWTVAKHVKSNAIVYARDRRTVGVGAGQMSRIHSARIAALKAAEAGLELARAAMASDAFFPFRDGIDAAHEAGVTAVIQPGGSRNDEQVVAAADEHGMAMLFTGMRHFRH